MPVDTTTEIMNFFLITLASVAGLTFFYLWLQDRRRQMNYQEMALKFQQKQSSNEAKSKLRDRELREEEIRQNMEFREKELSGVGSGGYISIDLPHDRIPLFQELLKGFEDYAKLQGYEIRFSADTTYPNRFAFKFTLGDEGIQVSTTKVKKDLYDYIDKVQSGDPLDDLPVVLPEDEHNLLLTIMKNRINFLQHNYNLKKNTVEYYEKLLERFTSQPGGVLPAPTVMVQTGGTMDSRFYKSIDSSYVIQGDNSKQIDSGIRIAHSFNERKDQIEKLTELIELLKNEPPSNSQDKAIINLDKVKAELSEEENPDKGRIIKWLQKTKDFLGKLELTKETIDKAKELFEAFSISDMLSSIF